METDVCVPVLVGFMANDRTVQRPHWRTLLGNPIFTGSDRVAFLGNTLDWIGNQEVADIPFRFHVVLPCRKSLRTVGDSQNTNRLAAT